jgi:hypothetical protein
LSIRNREEKEGGRIRSPGEISSFSSSFSTSLLCFPSSLSLSTSRVEKKEREKEKETETERERERKQRGEGGYFLLSLSLSFSPPLSVCLRSLFPCLEIEEERRKGRRERVGGDRERERIEGLLLPLLAFLPLSLSLSLHLKWRKRRKDRKRERNGDREREREEIMKP